jgi:hypothetical protein
LEVGLVVWAIAGIAMVAAMAMAPYRCDLMFCLRVAQEELGRRAMVPTTNEIGREPLSALPSVGTD